MSSTPINTDAKPKAESAKPEVKMVSVTVNGKTVQVPAGSPVIDAADAAGTFVPRYCYHPDLSIAGVCRMCVCEVEKNPRLQISCNTPAVDGMVVRTDTDKVKDAVKSALELHLINHPLDCPICDKAGECKLQDFYVDFGLYKSRKEMDEKVHKRKVVDIGTIILDSERCILCTRCVRFTAEVTKTNEFAILNRGDRSELQTYDQGPLRNDYTGNLADICPVGALTAKDFRFQQRVWFLRKKESVCTMCARGCNTTVSVNPSTKKMYRVEPRRNLVVNKSWMCDLGRWGYHHVSDEGRIRSPRQRVEGGTAERTWDLAFKVMSESLRENPKKWLVALSTQMTNEEIADSVLGLKQLGVDYFTWLVDEKVVGEKEPEDGVLLHRDRTGNAAGFEKVMSGLGVTWVKQTNALGLMGAPVENVLLLGMEGYVLPGVAAFVASIPKSVQIIAHATSETPFWDKTTWVLPNVSAYEKSGTVVNALSRLQKVDGPLPAQYTSRGAHALIYGILQGHDREACPASRAQQIFDSVVAPKLLKGQQSSWKRFPSKGISLEVSA